MTQEAFLEDGTAIQVPTQAEIDAQVEQKVGETRVQYEARITEMEKEINPNWRDARQVIKNLREQVEAKGFKVDEQGIIKDNTPISMADVEERAKSAARNELLSAEIENHLANYEKDERQAVKAYFNKLSSGEQLSVSSIGKIMNEAERLVFGENKSNVRASIGIRGGAPTRSDINRETFDKKPEGKDLMSKLGLKASEDK